MATGRRRDDAVNLPIEADLDEASAAHAGDQLADIVGSRFAAGLGGKGLNRARDEIGGLGRSINFNKIFDPFSKAAKEAALSTGPLDKRLEELTKDINALNTTAEATRATLAKTGADPRIFAAFDRQIESSLTKLHQFDKELKAGTATPEALDRLEGSLQLGQKNARQLLDQTRSTLKAESIASAKAAESARVERQQENQRALKESAQAHGKFVTQAQIEGAQVLAETRLAGQRQLQEERQRSRSRIELVRFTFQQIKILERGIAGVFRATGTIATSAFRTLGSAVDRIGGIFHRSNRDLNDGLNGALIQRERSILRSFSRQTNEVRTSTLEQARILQRFETQASTGVAGALTGRSSLGALFGGGIAIGGGFAAFQGLRNGIKVGGDFVQGLAVLGAQLELTEKQMAGVRQQSIELGNDITLPGVSALDAAQAIQLLAKQFANLGAGALPAAQAAAKGVLQLSRAAGVDAEEAARVVGAAVNVFGVNADRAVAVADQVTNALTKGAGVGFTEFADSFQQGATVFKLFVGPAEDAEDALSEFNATLATLAKGGIIGSVAGTGIKQLFLQANRGTKDAVEVTNELITRAGETGSIFFDAAGNARTFADAIDIVRRGTKGLSDAARSADLQKLFGSRATTIATQLISGTDEQFRALTESVLKQGSAAEIAAAQNTGLRGALDALGSVIETQQIKTYERYQGILGKVVLSFANLLNLFFEGKGKLGILRDGLIGIAGALGGLLAIKAVAEGFQFLALGIRAVLTPLGIFVTVAAGLGAAFNILRSRSPEFRAEVGKIGDVLQDKFQGGVDKIGDGLAALGQFLREVAIPRFVEFGNAAIKLVIPAIEKVGDALRTGKDLFEAFMAATRGEGVTSGGIFGFAERLGVQARQIGVATDHFIDAVRGKDDNSRPVSQRNEESQTRLVLLAEDLGRKLREAAEQARLFFGAIPALAAPAIDQFQQLGDAIGKIASGSIIDGLKSALASTSANQIAGALGGAAIGTAIGGPIGAAIGAAVGFGFGDKAVAAIRPQLERLVDFVGDFFSGAAGTAGGKLSKGAESFLLGPFQRAVTAVGFFIGNIASNPGFVAALEKIVGLAVLTGANFVKGVGQGIIKNVPGLANLIGDQVGDAARIGFRRAFNTERLLDPQTLLKTLLIAFSGGLVFVTLARRFAGDFIKSFTAAIKRGGAGLRTAFSGDRNPFFQGLFGNTADFDREAGRAIDRADTAAGKIQANFARRLRNLGQANLVGFEPGQFANSEAQFNDLADRVGGRARLLGIEVKESLKGAVGGVGTIASGVKQVVDGIRFDFADKGASTIKSGFGQIGRSLKAGFLAVKDNVKATAGGIGQALGGAILSGVGAALSGQQLGTAGSTLGKGIGLAGIISSALFAGASVGGGPQGILVGGIVAGIGLVTAKISESAQETARARDRANEWAEALKGVSAQQLVGKIASDIGDAVGKLDVGVQKVFTGFNFGVFSQQIERGTADSDAAFRALASNIGVSVGDINNVLANVDKAGGLKNLRDAIDNDTFRKLKDVDVSGMKALVAALDAGQISLDDFIRAREELTNQNTGVRTALSGFDIQSTFKFDVPAVVTATTALDNQADAAKRAGDQLAFLNINSERLQQRGENNFAAFTAQNIDNITTAIGNLDQARTDAINTRIADLSTKLDGAKQAADQALQSLLDLVNTPFGDPFGQSIDDLLTGVDQIGASLQEQITAGLDIGALFGETTPTGQGAAIRNIVDPFANAFQQAVAQAVVDNPGISGDALRAKFQPVFDEIAKGKIEIPNPDVEVGGTISINIPPAAQGILTDTLNTLLANKGLDAALNTVTISNEALADAQEQLNDAQLQLGLSVTFDPGQIAGELRRLGLEVPFASILGFLDAQTAANNQNAAVNATTLGGATNPLPVSQPAPAPVVVNQTNNFTLPPGSDTQTAAITIQQLKRTSLGAGFTALFG